MPVIQVGLIDTTGKLDPHLVEATAAALNVFEHAAERRGRRVREEYLAGTR